MTDYDKLMFAIEKYYGSGSDQWAEIEKYGLAADNAESILKQVPGVEIVKNANGSIRSYNILTSQNITPSTEIAVNSNVPAVVKSFNVPANTALTTVTTPAGETVKKMTFKSGMTQAGKFVACELLPAVAAVGTGITLGKTIDKALYNAIPDYWDEHGMSTLNPDTWGEIIGTDTAGHRVLNAILGTTPDNKTQVYIDENALAYMALYMQNKGAFIPQSITTSNNTFSVDSSSYTIEQSPQIAFNEGLPNNNTFLLGETDAKKPYTKYEVIDFAPSAKFIWTSYLFNPANPVARYIIASDKPFKIRRTINDSNYNNRVNILSPSEPFSDILSKHPFYIYDGSGVPSYGTSFYPSLLNNIYEYIDGKYQFSATINNNDTVFSNASAFNFLYGTRVTIGGIDGIGTQDGATVPEISDINTVEGVLDKLKLQYPGLFENAVTQDVVQPDGNTTTYTYVPIAMPELDENGNPVSSISTQANPEVDPTTATEPLLDIIANLIQKYPPTNPPDTGSGNTPSVIVPTGNASALYAIYNPTLTQINNLGAWLWSPNFIDQLLKLFSSPMDAIIGLHKVYATPATGGAQNIKVGYLDSGVPSKIVTDQYTTVDCGKVNCYEYFGNVLDYNPYTNIRLYLPFIGIIDLSNSDVMRSNINVVYHVDVLSGACLAEVKITRDGGGGTLYQYAGNAATTLPISSGSYMGVVSSVSSVATRALAGFASGGALGAIASGATGILNAQGTNVVHSGGFSGNAGAMGCKKPYLIIERPQTETADNTANLLGYGSNLFTRLKTCKGFTRVKGVHVDAVPATKDEKKLIEEKLMDGVIIG